jgi:hypothetical protein
LPTVKTLDTYADALVLERKSSDGMQIVAITFWRSSEAIRGLCGDDLVQAVVAAGAVALLTEYTRRVRHYEVALEDEL